MDLIELHNRKFVSQYNIHLFIELLQNNLQRIDYFGSRVRGKSSVNIYLTKDIEQNKILRFAYQMNDLIKRNILTEFHLNYKHLRCKLIKPFLTGVGGVSTYSELTDPIVLQFMCESYEARPLKPSKKLSILDIKNDPNWVVAGVFEPN